MLLLPYVVPGPSSLVALGSPVRVTPSATPWPKFQGILQVPVARDTDCGSGFSTQISPGSPGLVVRWAIEFAKAKGCVKAPGLSQEPGSPSAIQPQVPGNNLPCSAPLGFKATYLRRAKWMFS